MTIDLFLLIIWIIGGVLIFVSAVISGDYKISIRSYAYCWVCLIIQLIMQLQK